MKTHTQNTSDPTTLSLRLTLSVRYILNGESPAFLRSLLDRLPNIASGEGLLTGDSPAEVDEWDATIEEGTHPARATLAHIQDVLSDVTQAFRTLADQAGDVEEWNEGGEAYEASKRVRALREQLQTEQDAVGRSPQP